MNDLPVRQNTTDDQVKAKIASNKTLFVLRHAESSWAQSGTSDFERPLNDIGRENAALVGKILLQNGYDPDVILSSPATRTAETTHLVMEEAELTGETSYEQRIYDASAKTLQHLVSEINDTYDSALLVGHNPGIEGFIKNLSGNLEEMSPGSFAVIDLKIETWRAITENCGSLTKIFTPRK